MNRTKLYDQIEISFTKRAETKIRPDALKDDVEFAGVAVLEFSGEVELAIVVSVILKLRNWSPAVHVRNYARSESGCWLVSSELTKNRRLSWSTWGLVFSGFLNLCITIIY